MPEHSGHSGVAEGHRPESTCSRAHSQAEGHKAAIVGAEKSLGHCILPMSFPVLIHSHTSPVTHCRATVKLNSGW